MRARPLLYSFLLTTSMLGLAATSSGEPCVVGDSTPGTLDSPGPHGEVGVTVGDAYVFKDHAPLMATIDGEEIVFAEDVGNWVYIETNDIAGLQRFDWWVDDTCAGEVPSDFWVW